MIQKNILLPGKHGRPVMADIYKTAEAPAPVVLFVHGFKGFKDWGHWHLIAQTFADEGFAFVAINLSHNGVTPEDPLNFADLEAFGHNNYTIELDDIRTALDYIETRTDLFDASRIAFIGHSRSGATGIVTAAEDARIKALVTWASISRTGYIFSDSFVQEITQNGVVYSVNARTGDKMPLYRQFYDDWHQQQERLHLATRIASLNIPILIVHGDTDPAVPVSAAHDLQAAAPAEHTHQHIIAGADHVFQGKHPWTGSRLPAESTELCAVSIAFLKNYL